MKKILVISPIPTHPQSNGGRSRIYFLLTRIKKMGYEIHFIYYNTEKFMEFPQKPNIKEMKKDWEKVYIVVFNFYTFIRLLDSYIGRLGIFLNKNFPKIYIFLKNIKKKLKLNSYSELDDLYNPQIDATIKLIKKKEKFDVVLTIYDFFSKALDNFNDSTLKVIDTIDAFTSDDSYSANKETRKFTREQEAKAVNRADVVIAIQDEEKKFFEKFTDKDKKVVTIGHMLALKNSVGKFKDKNILFMGASTPPNFFAIDFFIKEVFHKIKFKYPDATFSIAGSFEKIQRKIEGVNWLGYVRNEAFEKAYENANVVVVPLFFGTGQKTRCLEALVNNKLLIVTDFGAIGFEKGKNKAFLIANTGEEFVEQISRIFYDKEIYEKILENAHKFIIEYNKNNTQRLKEVFNNNQ